jgi:hypothetical protein
MTVAPPGPTLIVPIDVAALCVGTDDQSGTHDSPYCTRDFARVAADFSTLPYLDANGQSVNSKAYISEQVTPQPFDTNADGLGPGVHLHWALPDALAHGVSDADGNVQFRSAPNRWLVVRIASSHATPTAPAVATRAWVVESDHLWDPEADQGTVGQNANSLAVPLQPQTQQHPNKSYQALGRVFPHDTWSEQSGGTYLPKHTALGYGTVTYAAAYPNCPNVFGMHDPLDDLDLTTFPPTTSRLSYLVVGWYSTTDNDPLAQYEYTKDSDYAAQLAQLQQAFHWTLSADGNTRIPTQIVCDGLLTDVPWDPARRYVVKRPETPLQVAIGNTTIEALSALLASQPELQELDNVERVLTWLQLNMLARLGQAGALGEIEEAQHQADFGSATAGTIWQVQRATPGNSTPDCVSVTVNDQDLLDAASGVEVTLPEDLASDLNTLNVTQLAYDKAGLELESRRRQVFADWYKYMLLEYPEQGAPPAKITADQAFHYIQGEITALNTASTAHDGLKTTRDTEHDALVTKLGNGYLLTSVASPRYWQTNDPVLLLSGDDAEPSYRHGGDGRFDPDGNLVCRLTSGLISSMTVAAAGGHGPWTVHTGDLPALPSPKDQPHLAEIQALVGEAFFVDRNQAWRLAQAVAAQGGDGNPAGNLNVLVQAIQTTQGNLFTASPLQVVSNVTFTGQVPSLVGIQAWAQPWIPLMLQWEIYYFPLQSIGSDTGQKPTYPADFITSQCHLDDDDIDLTYLKPVTPGAAAPQIYQGSLVLSHNTEINLANQIDRFVENYPNDSHVGELQTIKANLRLSMMAQALDGFNQALLMRHQTLQLPVADPLAISNGLIHWRFTNQLVANAVDHENTLAPLPLNPYNPLRAGVLEVTQLRLIDAFGQIRDIDKPTPLRAESLRPVGESPSGTLVTLPPRITQPSRLLLRWLSASDDNVETNSHPASSPVCGWVLFNHLDDSLMLYAADGTPLGSLNVRGPVWQGAPGNNTTFDQPIETALANANPHLQKFAYGIAHNPNAVNFLRDLLTTIDATVTLVNPASFKQDHGLSVLISQPLALCRASLRLDLQGLPSLNQSWDVFDQAVNDSQGHGYTIDDTRDAADFPNVTFPVRLGDLSQINDGLIGYVIDDGTEQAYRTFYAAASTSPANGVVRPKADQLLVTGDDGAADILLTMLMDPRASVHATAGFLPVKSLRIPPDMYTPALNRLSVSFLTTPVLSPAASFAVPTPHESGYVWSWVTKTAGATGWTIVDPVSQLKPGATLASPQQISEGWLNLHKAPPLPPPPPKNGAA